MMNFPEHFTDVQRELTNALWGLATFGSKVMERHGDLELFISTAQWSSEFASWVVKQDVVSDDEVREVLDFIYEYAMERQNQQRYEDGLAQFTETFIPDPKVAELEELFNAPSFGEDSDEVSES